MTPEESLLWMHLSNRKIDGLKFRFQNGVLFYIADFFCFERMLGIELDGNHHYTPEGRKRDAIRDDDFNSLGITVLRFPNYRVRNDVIGVVEEIRRVARSLPEHKRGNRKRGIAQDREE
jgi:very-short-patch-repair endonuclease